MRMAMTGTPAPDHLPDAGERFAPDDARYRAVLDRQFNKRFRASPEYVRAVGSTAQVVAAVDEAVRTGRRLVATSGGHCLEGFVSDPDVRVIVDLSPMRRIAWDSRRRAVEVEAGATVGETFKTLFERWGVVVPLGEHPGIGIGGHVAGGAFGFLCRQLGLAVDYLEAVEVVTIGASGSAAAVVASRDPADPNHDLWWAHTGGGAGSFGILTRCWFRSAGASGDEPSALLPAAPRSIATFTASWTWTAVERAGAARLLRNFVAWCGHHAGADSPFASLWTLLVAQRRQAGRIVLRGVSTAGDAAAAQIDRCLAAIGEGIDQAPHVERQVLTWLDFALDPFPDLFAGPPGGVSVKIKDALLRQPLTDRQIDVACSHLTRDDCDVPGGMLGLASYGGRINDVSPDATAAAQRGSIIDLACTAGWLAPADADANLAWVRTFYCDLFAGSGGVPVPGEATDGAFINHPDTDLADAAWNRSGVPWTTLYYQDNAARLQRIKARWDPRNVFRHALSIPLP
jgi:FAD/FMN-containing dehydrogenase